MPSFQFDRHTGILRFFVRVGERSVTAFLSESTWQTLPEWQETVADLGEFYEQNRGEIDRVVARKVKAGARSPVVVRAGDL
jgi:hypothetical protein